MLIVHHLNNSRSQRVLWLLEELGAPYSVQFHARDPVSRRAPAGLKAVHPLGKSPIVSIGDVVLAESGLIAEYLCDQFPERALAPPKSAGPDHPDRLRCLYWIHYAEGSAMAPLLLKLLVGGIEHESVDALKTGFIETQLNEHSSFWEEHLGATGWFGGASFSVADIMMGYPVEVAARFGYASGRPNLQAFLQRIQDRPAYKRAAERGAHDA